MKSFSQKLPLDFSNLSESERLDLAYGLAKDKSTDPELLRALAEEESLDVRWVLAMNPNTPEDVLRAMAFDPEEHHNVLFGLSWNPKLPPDVAKHLLGNEEFNDSFVDYDTTVYVRDAEKKRQMIKRLQDIIDEATPQVGRIDLVTNRFQDLGAENEKLL